MAIGNLELMHEYFQKNTRALKQQRNKQRNIRKSKGEVSMKKSNAGTKKKKSGRPITT